MLFLKLFGASSSVRITYVRAGTTQIYTTASAALQVAYPDLFFKLSNPKYLQRSSITQVTAQELVAGYVPFVVEFGDANPPPSSALQYDVVKPPFKVATKHFSERRSRGEILLNPYAIGKYSVTREWEYDRSESVITSSVNYPISLIQSGNASFSLLGVSLPTYGKQNSADTVKTIALTLGYKVRRTANARIVMSPEPVFPGTDYDILEELVTEAVADRNNGTYDLLTEVGEFPETLAYVTDLTKKAFFIGLDADAASRELSVSKLGIKRYAKKLSSVWLQMRYALFPIFYSIKDISEVLHQMGRLYAEYKKSAQVVNADDFPQSGDSAYTVSVVSGQITHRAFIKSRYSPDTLIQDLQRLINVNLLTSAWELTKLSFVWGWVINFGDYLSAVSGSDHADESLMTYSFRDKRQVTISYTNTNLPPMKTTVTIDSYKRLVINPADHVGLKLRLDMGWKRYIDAAALSINPLTKYIRGLK